MKRKGRNPVFAMLFPMHCGRFFNKNGNSIFQYWISFACFFWQIIHCGGTITLSNFMSKAFTIFLKKLQSALAFQECFFALRWIYKRVNRLFSAESYECRVHKSRISHPPSFSQTDLETWAIILNYTYIQQLNTGCCKSIYGFQKVWK